MTRYILFKSDFLIFKLFILLSMFVSSSTVYSRDKVDVFATIPPIAFFVEKIGGEAVNVHSLISENDNPHTYAPTPKGIIELGRSRMIFSINLPFEKSLIDKLKRLKSGPKVIDLTKNVKFRSMACVHDAHHCNHTSKKDPHIWFGPEQIKVIGANIANALTINSPHNEDLFKKNLKSFLEELDKLDANLAKRLSPYKGTKVLVFHPSFGYLADAYDLKQEAVEIEGKSPSPRQIIKLIREAKRENIKTIFVQPQFDTKAAANIASAIKGEVVHINPMKRDVFKNMEYMVGMIIEPNQ